MLEITNKKRGRSIVRVTGNTATAINLSHLSVNTTTEIINSATIDTAISSGNGYWKIYRGDDASGNVILDLFANANLPLLKHQLSISTNSTSNIYVTNSGTGGTLILEISKQATYSPALTDF